MKESTTNCDFVRKILTLFEKLRKIACAYFQAVAFNQSVENWANFFSRVTFKLTFLFKIV
jgi:hypothetical protein